MKPRLNRNWHLQHPMPARATLEQRVAWHEAHRKQCGCRPVPPGLLKQMKKAGLTFKSV